MNWNYTKPKSKTIIRVIVFRLMGRIHNETMYETKFCLYNNKEGFFIGNEKITDIVAWMPEPESPPVKYWNKFIKSTTLPVSMGIYVE